jgi:hypothetical protein
LCCKSSRVTRFGEFCPTGYCLPGLPDLSWSKHTRTVKVYQMTTNYTKRLCIIPDGHKLYQTAVKVYQHFPFQGPPKYTQLGIFGPKINHLAPLLLAMGRFSKITKVGQVFGLLFSTVHAMY